MDTFWMFTSYHFHLKFLKLTIAVNSQVNVEYLRRLHLPNLKHFTLQIVHVVMNTSLRGFPDKGFSLHKCTPERYCSNSPLTRCSCRCWGSTHQRLQVCNDGFRLQSTQPAASRNKAFSSLSSEINYPSSVFPFH